MRTYVEVLALNLAGVLAQSSLAQMSSINVKTAERYDRLLAEVLAAHTQMRLHHLRTLNGRQEIDFVVEGPGRRVLAIEVKAASAVNQHDARHIELTTNR